ncbi:MAG: hypothetical protein SFY32_10755, partial [Bacteroidota bacterium]|nr:hypothetical protein [Bacteroidota bacterium]
MSFGQPLTFSPPSGSQVIGSNGGSFQLTINKSFAGGITIYNFPVGLSSSSTTDLTPTITVAANNGPGRSLSFNVYGNGVTYTYTVSQLGINCTSLTGTNPTSITGNLNPCLNQTITYSLPTLSAGMWY